MAERQYLWETHMHTSESSRCARSTAAEMIAAYAAAGFEGVFVTDHFINGNSYGSDPDMPWQQRMDCLVAGYHKAQEAACQFSIQVFFGFEFTHRSADFLTYGITEKFLRKTPEIETMSLEAFAACVHEAGGFLVQAHPFREAWYLEKKVAKRCDLVDGIEVINGSHRKSEERWDASAASLAVAHGLCALAGSDAHWTSQAATAAMAFQSAIESEAAFFEAVQSGKGTPLRLYSLPDAP